MEKHAMRVAVIGCGPSSLAAAWGARGLGADVEIYGPKIASAIRGAVLLHTPIPGITLDHPTGYVRQIVIGGNISEYGRKLYGDQHVSREGDPFYKGFHTWSVPETYAKLWEIFEPDMKRAGEVDRWFLDRMVDRFDLVVNTAPAPQFCQHSGHKFESASVDLTWATSVPNQEDNTVYYSADPEIPWARSSSIFGSRVTEWLSDRAPESSHRISKPLSTTCDCYPDVYRAGRYGAWDNRAWIETAYYGTRERILGV